MNHRDLITALTPRYGSGEARAIVRLLMEERFGLSQTDLLLGKDRPFFLIHQEEIEKYLSQLLVGVPVQYVLGFADFCGHRFRVSPEVLIPRPETEELVAWAVEEMRAEVSQTEQDTIAREAILDLCTGSGCIAISLALEFPEHPVLAVDISKDALAVARQNANDLGADNIHFLQADILHPQFVHEWEDGHFCHSAGMCPDADAFPTVEAFSLLVSNPPYVCAGEAAEMDAHVLDHEPSLALFVPDDDPLRFYQTIARVGRACLVAGGHLLVEMNAAFAESTRELFVEAGYADVCVRNDQFGRPRMLCARKK